MNKGREWLGKAWHIYMLEYDGAIQSHTTDKIFIIMKNMFVIYFYMEKGKAQNNMYSIMVLYFF